MGRHRQAGTINNLDIIHMDLLKAICLRFKHQPVITILLSLSFIITSCDRENDDFIAQPTETSTILTGYVKTPDGTPLSGIPVSVDFKVAGILGSSVIHKAKGTTDKSGFYKIFFEADNENHGASSGYVFSADFSVLSQDDYIIAERLDYGFTAFKNEWSGSTIKCDFTIPHRRLVDVTVHNDGIPVLNGTYAVRGMFQYLKVEGYLLDDRNPWNDVSIWHVSESVDIPQNGSTSVTLPCGVGVDNAVRVVYHGDESIGYPSGIPASGGKIIEITGGFSDKIELNYQTPDPDNRWDDLWE